MWGSKTRTLTGVYNLSLQSITRIMVVNQSHGTFPNFGKPAMEVYDEFYLISLWQTGHTVSRKDLKYNVEVADNPERKRSPFAWLLVSSSLSYRAKFFFSYSKWYYYTHNYSKIILKYYSIEYTTQGLEIVHRDRKVHYHFLCILTCNMLGSNRVLNYGTVLGKLTWHCLVTITIKLFFINSINCSHLRNKLSATGSFL